MNLPEHPRICEIDVWSWLADLSRRCGRPVRLGDVMAEQWDAVASPGWDAAWLRGVWQRSRVAALVAGEDRTLVAEARRLLAGFRPADVVGSPFAVRAYAVDERLGGDEGLASARRELARRGVRLLLDFLPNHTAPDHPWVFEHPERYVRGAQEELRRHPGVFFEAGGQALAHARDPHFPPWPDSAQLDVFHPGLRRASSEILLDIAGRCDGVRCHMAMLALNRVFGETWGERVGPAPSIEFWAEVIGAVRRERADFLFVAEDYWGVAWELLGLGFDFCYDERLRDRLVRGSASDVRAHLGAAPDFQARVVRFLEHHGEPRAAAALSPARHAAAAVVALTVPGARLLHDGQAEGRRERALLPLGRNPAEEPDEGLCRFYGRLLACTAAPAFRRGAWGLCESSGWAEDPSWANLLSWSWTRGDERWLVVVNFSESPAHGRVRLPWEDLAGRSWRLSDALSDQTFERSGGALAEEGLYVGLPPWGVHLLRLE